MRVEPLNDDRTAELAWLRTQLDEMAGENVHLQQRALATQRELEIRRRGFSLLARMGTTLGAHTELEPALGAVLPIVEAELGVQRTVALRRDSGRYVPFAWSGFPAVDAVPLAGARLDFGDALDSTEGVLVTKDIVGVEWIDAVREILRVPVFVAVAIGDAGHALLVARPDERAGFFPRFDEVDVDSLGAVAEMVNAAVQNTRIAALSELKRFLPPSVVDELMTGRLAAEQGHERREVTLLVADMVGFTRLADEAEPDVLADILNAYLRDMTTLAHAFGGTVGSLAGDGLLVIFGAPEDCPPEEHAWRATEAAFAMRARMEVLAVELDEHGSELQIRIGLNTGSCAVGVFGSDTQRTYTAIGMPVNLAARLEASAAPGEVLVSPTTYALMGRRVDARRTEPLTLKGISRPVVAHAVDPSRAGG